jgi:hypothetical protein
MDMGRGNNMWGWSPCAHSWHASLIGVYAAYCVEVLVGMISGW